MKITVQGKVKTEICDARTGKVLKTQVRKNLVFDIGLNAMAQQGNAVGVCQPAGVFTNAIVGSGNSPNQIASGAVTFTQSGTTVTASAGFFTSGMVGAIFKYGTGTGGAEYYITAFTDTTHVTVDTSATVITPTLATIWMVQKTALDNVSHAADSYQTLSGNCQTTFAGATVTHQRIFIIAEKPSPYTVNEIGYNAFTIGTTTNTVAGRFVLASGDVVGTTNFYRVTIQLAVVYSPASPTTVANVGTNINTAGTAALEDVGQLHVVASSGAVSTIITNPSEDGGFTNTFRMCIATYTQNSTPGASGRALNWPSTIDGGVTGSWAYGGSRGLMTATFAYSLTTSGQTAYGVGIASSANGNNPFFDILFTTPQTLPTGTFSGTVQFSFTYARNLSN